MGVVVVSKNSAEALRRYLFKIYDLEYDLLYWVPILPPKVPPFPSSLELFSHFCLVWGMLALKWTERSLLGLKLRILGSWTSLGLLLGLGLSVVVVGLGRRRWGLTG